ncbi:MAG: putative membrane protein [Bacteroidia bacterium]|jgi:uncharacterized membrane protein
MKKWSRIIFSVFFLVGGINHFVNPATYIPLIPDYFPAKELLNLISGVAEIVFGLGLLFPKTRKLSAYGIIALLIAFIPAHVFFIQQGSCIGDLCVPDWVGWVRLILVHPLLVLWAWKVR